MSMVNLNKPCEAEDFRDPELLAIIREVYATEVQRRGPHWPAGVEMRKEWEVAMAVLAMRRAGAIRDDALVLGVGAGSEPTIFYLTNFVRWVFATDLYAAARGWEHTAPSGMLTSPESLTDMSFNARRLVTQHMDGRSLRYEDETFDALFSSSSIEHFGSWENVAMAAKEMGRVLKRGGVLTLSTEFRLSGKGKGPSPDVLAFSWEELQALIIEPAGLRLFDQPKLSVSAETRNVVVPEKEMIENVNLVLAGKAAQWKTFPHIVLEGQGYRWTSFHLALTKD